jgi:hypothetical protein
MQAVYLLKTLQSFSQGSVAEALHSRNWVHLCHRTHGHVLKEWVPQSFQKGNPVPCKPAIIRRQTSERNDATKKDTWPHRKFRKRLNDFQQPVDTRQMHQSLPKFPKMLINKKNKKNCWSTKKYINFLLINKSSNVETHQNVDQQKKLLINKISTSNFVHQQNCDFSILSLAKGDRPPRGSARQIFGSHFEP